MTDPDVAREAKDILQKKLFYIEEDLLRFGDYNWAAFRKHHKRTHTLAIYGPAADESALDALLDRAGIVGAVGDL